MELAPEARPLPLAKGSGSSVWCPLVSAKQFADIRETNGEVTASYSQKPVRGLLDDFVVHATDFASTTTQVPYPDVPASTADTVNAKSSRLDRLSVDGHHGTRWRVAEGSGGPGVADCMGKWPHPSQGETVGWQQGTPPWQALSALSVETKADWIPFQSTLEGSRNFKLAKNIEDTFLILCKGFCVCISTYTYKQIT